MRSACAKRLWCARACVRGACVCGACVRACAVRCVRACVRSCVRACVRGVWSAECGARCVVRGMWCAVQCGVIVCVLSATSSLMWVPWFCVVVPTHVQEELQLQYFQNVDWGFVQRFDCVQVDTEGGGGG